MRILAHTDLVTASLLVRDLRRVIAVPILFAVLLAAAPATLGQDNAEAFFETHIRPVLVRHCYECHSLQSGRSRGGLRVDMRAALLEGGVSGPALVPGSADESLLLQAMEYHDPFLEMPPAGKLPDAVINHFRRWIDAGAYDPREPEYAPAVASGIDIEQGREHWAYQPPRRADPPEVTDNAWPLKSIDRFILAELEANGFGPAEDAEPAVLVRRAFMLLIGLPPTPRQQIDWAGKLGSATSPQQRQAVMSKLVDELLASPQFGERWGRHWLDVARFAESTGGDSNDIHPHAWRYRNYVIDAFNDDKPFDRFVLEQIAGDLLPIKDDKDWADNLVATGFLATGVKMVGEPEARAFFADLVDEQIDATSRAFLATTVACARCHDHKSDAIPQSDYYALAGFFRSTQTHYGLLPAQARQPTPLLDLTGMGLAVDRDPLSSAELARLIAERDAAQAQMNETMAEIRSGDGVTRNILLRSRTRLDQAEAALAMYDRQGRPRVLVMGVQDRPDPMPTRLAVRGEVGQYAQLVPRGYLQVLSPPGEHELAEDTTGSGRLELARWIASPDNPLTARVIANRVWQHLFGEGLVRSVDDFGRSGETPSHPELLDYLALRLIDLDWSIKALIREIMTSRSWQMASTYREAAYNADPDNRLLWRMNKQRLEAEAIRDAMLAASGQIDLRRPRGTLLSGVGEGTVGRSVYEPVIRAIESDCRSVYLPRVRNVLPDVLELFDAPDASLVMGRREVTTSPLQGLYMLNSPFVIAQADAMGARLAGAGDDWITSAFLLAYARHPNDVERDAAVAFYRECLRMLREDGQTTDTHQQARAAFCQALFAAAEFRRLD